MCCVYVASIPIDPPNGTPPPPPGELLKDVQMAEVFVPNAQPNGNHRDGLNGDVAMDDVRAESSVTTPEAPPESMVSADGSQAGASGHDEEDKPPPAKRARMHSDADKASLAHVSPRPFLYASIGVLIQHVLCAVSSEVCHSSPRFGDR